jgi:hypothetical protein
MVHWQWGRYLGHVTMKQRRLMVERRTRLAPSNQAGWIIQGVDVAAVVEADMRVLAWAVAVCAHQHATQTQEAAAAVALETNPSVELEAVVVAETTGMTARMVLRGKAGQYTAAGLGAELAAAALG